MEQISIFTLFYISGVLFNIIVLLTTCHTFIEIFEIPPAFKITIGYLTLSILTRVRNFISYAITVSCH